MTVVELAGASKTYPGGVTALDGVDLSVEYGEMAAIVGPSGSGKSTMLHLIGTLDRPSSGQVYVDGHDVAALSDREVSALRARRIGFVFQQFHLAGGVSAVDNVADGLLYAGVGSRERRTRAAEALDRVGLLGQANVLAGRLRLLDRKRLELARALATGPRLVLLDEIAGGLTEHEVAVLVDTIRQLLAEGVTVVWIEHVVHAVLAVANRLLCLAYGRSLALGAPAEVIASPAVREVYLGGTPESAEGGAVAL